MEEVYIRYGARSTLVQEMQRRLNEYFDYTLKVDGIFGHKTAKAIFSFNTRYLPDLNDKRILTKATYTLIARPELYSFKDVFQNKNLIEEGSENLVTRATKLIDLIAEDLNISKEMLRAVIYVESGNHAFLLDEPIIRFEAHVFKRNLSFVKASTENLFNSSFQITNSSRPWLSQKFFHPKLNKFILLHFPNEEDPDTKSFSKAEKIQYQQLMALEAASKIDENAAYRAISVGLPQIMGFNHFKVGHLDPKSMYNAFKFENFHITAFADFIAGYNKSERILDHLRNLNFYDFASFYNGSGQAATYSDLIKTRYDHELRMSKKNE